MRQNHLVAGALLSAIALVGAGCGTGGDAFDSGASGELAFQVDWEQPAGFNPSGGNAQFTTPIPDAVQTVRITVASTDAGSANCCIAVNRADPEFVDRFLVLGALPAGDIAIRVSGYPRSNAPADGFTRRCATSPANAGRACSLDIIDTPSFDSDPIDVTVVAGTRVDAGAVPVFALPFLAARDPQPDGQLEQPTAAFSLTVADAVHDIDTASIAVSLINDATGQSLVATLQPLVACNELSASATSNPPCSPGGNLDIQGWRVDGSFASPPLGAGRLRIVVANDDLPARVTDHRFPVTVVPNMGSTTTTTTVSTTTTTTTLSTTTTTAPGATTTTTTTTSTTTSTSTTSSTTSTLPTAGCVVSFGLNDAIDLIGIRFDVSYGASQGDFTGSGDQVSCQPNDALGTVAIYNDADSARSLTAALISSSAFTGPILLTTCDFIGPNQPLVGDFVVTTTEATAPDFSLTTATVGVTDIVCTQ